MASKETEEFLDEIFDRIFKQEVDEGFGDFEKPVDVSLKNFSKSINFLYENNKRVTVKNKGIESANQFLKFENRKKLFFIFWKFEIWVKPKFQFFENQKIAFHGVKSAKCKKLYFSQKYWLFFSFHIEYATIRVRFVSSWYWKMKNENLYFSLFKKIKFTKIHFSFFIKMKFKIFINSFVLKWNMKMKNWYINKRTLMAT